MKTTDNSNTVVPSESLEDAARFQYKNVGYHPFNDGTLHLYLVGAEFGAKWQKKRMQQLIDSLVFRLKCNNATFKAMMAGRPHSYDEAAKEGIDLNLNEIEKANNITQTINI